MDQELAKVFVPALADAQQLGSPAGARLPRHQPEPGGKVPPSSERLACPDRCQQGSCVQHPNAGDGGQTTGSLISLRARAANSSSKAPMRRSSSRHLARISATSARTRGLRGEALALVQHRRKMLLQLAPPLRDHNALAPPERPAAG